MRTLSLFALTCSLMPMSPLEAQSIPPQGCRVVTLSTGGIRGQIIDKQSSPVPAVRVLVFRDNHIIAFSESDTQGHFKIGCLPPGQYQFKTFKDGCLPIIIDKITVKSGHWFTPTAGFWIPPCGNDYRTGIQLAAAAEYYDSEIGQATIFSREELDKLPISR